MNTIHENDTGSFQELAHSYDVSFGQLSILNIAQFCSRGGHYHRRKYEWFCCIHGMCALETYPMGRPEDKAERRLIRREFAPVEPYLVHTLRNAAEGDCELLVISSEVFDPRDTDTYKDESREVDLSEDRYATS